MTRKIDYFFSIGSPWAYLGLEPFLALAKAHGAAVEPHVIPVIEENGGIYSRNRPETRRAYWLNDLRRWAKRRDVTLKFDGRQNLADPARAGFDADALEAVAGSQAVAARRQRSYETAKTAGIFGVPTYLSDGELFWGQDSLPFLQSHLEGEKLVA